MTDGLVVRVPASSANLGAGFDVLGMALDLYADVGSGVVPADAHAIDDHHPATIAHRSLGGDGALWFRSSIPMGRGLGFSGAARIGGAALAAVQRSTEPSAALVTHREEILDVVAALEGHGDNAVASLDGGITAWLGDTAMSLRVGPQLRASSVVVWIPEATTSTNRSRSVLSSSVERVDVVHNLGKVVQFTLAVERDEPELLVGATADRIHQPQRLEQHEVAERALAVGVAAGAWCGWLSGSGPTLAFLAPDDTVDAIRANLPDSGHCKTLRIAPTGAHLVA